MKHLEREDRRQDPVEEGVIPVDNCAVLGTVVVAVLVAAAEAFAEVIVVVGMAHVVAVVAVVRIPVGSGYFGSMMARS